MASASTHLLLLSLLCGSMLISPSLSLTCTSQTFKTSYPKCVDLPLLDAFLHWTYDTSKSTLSLAYIGTPTTADGWVSWGINPYTTGMVGTQAFIAFKDSKGSMVVKTYNLTSVKTITEQKLIFKVLDSKAEASDGVMRIFATLKLPEKTTAVTHLWQAGAAVMNGMPQKHDFDPDNMHSKGTLNLAAGTNSPITPPAAGGGEKNNATAPTRQIGKDTSESSSSSRITWKRSFYGFLFIIIGALGLKH